MMAYPTEADVKRLSKVAGKKISLVLPTHRYDPDNRGDKILAENMIREIKAHFKESSMADVDQLIERLEFVIKETNWQQARDGIVYLVSKEHAETFDLDHQPTARFNYGDHFALIEISRQIALNPDINVLLLSELPTRFFFGKPGDLKEVNNEDFPVIHEGPGGQQGLPTGFGQMTSIVRDENHRKFFRGIEISLMKQLKITPGPLFLLGVVRYLSFWKEVAPQIELAGEKAGSFDKYSIPEIQALIRPLVDDFIRIQCQSLEKEVNESLSKKMAAHFSELDSLAEDGKLAKIVVARRPADLSEELELMAWKTLRTGGSVEFIEASTLLQDSPAIGIIRF
jgi:hypothetical protein